MTRRWQLVINIVIRIIVDTYNLIIINIVWSFEARISFSFCVSSKTVEYHQDDFFQKFKKKEKYLLVGQLWRFNSGRGLLSAVVSYIRLGRKKMFWFVANSHFINWDYMMITKILSCFSNELVSFSKHRMHLLFTFCYNEKTDFFGQSLFLLLCNSLTNSKVLFVQFDEIKCRRRIQTYLSQGKWAERKIIRGHLWA